MTEVPSWLSRRIPSLMRTGHLNLTNERISDFSALRTPEFAKYLKLIKQIEIKGTLISSLDEMPPMPNLLCLIGDGSQIGTLKGFEAIPNITKISLKNTPVSRYNSYKLSLLVICKNLVAIDNAIIPRSLKRKAGEYGEIASQLINKGWMVEIPCPSQDRYSELCEKFGVEMISEIELEESKSEQDQQIDEFEDFEAVVQAYRERQDIMFAETEEWFGIEPEFNFEAELAAKISNLFGRHGVPVDETNDDLIVQAVADLCEKAMRIDNRTPSSLTEDEEPASDQ